MSRLLFVAAAVLAFVPAAQAKGPFELCGASGCVELAPETSPPSWLSAAAGARLLPAVGPAPYLRIRWGHGEIAAWVPSAGALFDGAAAAWVSPLDSLEALLREKAVGLTPYAAPVHAVAYVDWERVRDGDGYLRLMTAGTPVGATPARTRWVDVRVMGGTSPWNDGTVSLSVSRSGYLLRAGRTYRISPVLARRVLARRPLG